MVHEFGHLTRDVMSTSDQLGEPMKKRTRPTFSPEFRLEASQLVVGQNYIVILATKGIKGAFLLWLNGRFSYSKSVKDNSMQWLR